MSRPPYCGRYELEGFHIDVEYRRSIRDSNLYRTAARTRSIVDTRAWSVAGSCRVGRRLESGAYSSEYLVADRKDTKPATAHQFDTVVGGRVNFLNHSYTEVEGRFFDRAPVSPAAARGFYSFVESGRGAVDDESAGGRDGSRFLRVPGNGDLG